MTAESTSFWLYVVAPGGCGGGHPHLIQTGEPALIASPESV